MRYWNNGLTIVEKIMVLDKQVQGVFEKSSLAI